jgi:hypothetical protein
MERRQNVLECKSVDRGYDVWLVFVAENVRKRRFRQSERDTHCKGFSGGFFERSAQLSREIANAGVGVDAVVRGLKESHEFSLLVSGMPR